MAKLERVTAKVFASDAPADKIGQFGSALAGTKLETGDVSTIQALPAYTEGWSSAVISQRNYPVLQETNGVMKNMSYQTAYIMQNGIAEYDPDTEYYAGSICKGIGNTNQYASLGDENIGNAITNSQYWKNVTPVNYSNITNCITEVPQRIKLELVDGAAILKAGSEVIVPNGENTFDYVTIESDLTCPNGGTGSNTDAILCYNATSKTLTYGSASSVTSGTTAPTGSGYFYDTNNNVIKYYSSGAPQGYIYSFPIALVTRENGAFTTVKNLFNGFGYIGSTVWVDKGVKGLIPNGRNEDGSLKNIEVTSDKLYLRTYTTGINNTNVNFIFQPNNTERPIGYILSSRLVSNWEGINYIKDVDGTIYQGFMYATGDVTNGVITSFNPKQPFRAIDYSDKSQISGWGMPSNKYIDLTLGASGSTYTAPANGYFYLQKKATNTTQVLLIVNNGKIGSIFTTNDTSTQVQGYIPASIGDTLKITYTLGGETTNFRFIYAEGEV